MLGRLHQEIRLFVFCPRPDPPPAGPRPFDQPIRCYVTYARTHVQPEYVLGCLVCASTVFYVVAYYSPSYGCYLVFKKLWSVARRECGVRQQLAQ